MNKSIKNNFLYFSTLEVKNVKCFDDQSQILDLRRRDGSISPWTIILGDNGIGKTTLLKCLAWMSPVQAPEVNEDIVNIGKALLSEDVDIEKICNATGLDKDVFLLQDSGRLQVKPYMDDFEDEEEYEKIMRNGKNVETHIVATFCKNISLGESTLSENEFSIGMKLQKEDGKLTIVEPQLHETEEYIVPNIYAYSASRHIATKNLDNAILKNPLYNLFSTSSDLYDAEQLLSDLYSTSIFENGKGLVTDLLNKLKSILVDLLPNLDKPEHIIINPPLDDKGNKVERLVEIKTPTGNVPLYNLSLGYQTMLSWAVDLGIRMLWQNPDSVNPLEEAAIVIIDEIDLHLHPKWQRELRGLLTKHFKNTQFICTAHSPFMAQSAENENLCVIEKTENKVVINNDTEAVSGWRIGQIVTSDLFGLESDRSVEIQNLLDRRTALKKKNRLSKKEDDELKQIDVYVDNLPIGENKAEINAAYILRKYAAKLENVNKVNND
ncbi:MAG: AAA family ATPase [Flavobacterium nitrogenifigens]|uniref:AAA family ATPase n=1 Tax=Flavobacterium nitrogenifigens TaxID=1617283 RepID=UPI002806CD6F|nr:AAA family ATPase [Flavobacterium nitrogenifigens]MDQ8015234.1 AAA family ATPase [Flavobacterium nitrogenifigens]